MNEREQLLAQLRDIHLPAAEAPAVLMNGFLAALMLALACVAAFALLRRWRRRRLYAALAELRRIERRHARDGDATALARELAALLRRRAMHCFPAAPVAAMVDAEWLAFLDAHGGDGGFRNGPGAALASLPYRAPGAAPADAPGMLQLAERWLRANPG